VAPARVPERLLARMFKVLVAGGGGGREERSKSREQRAESREQSSKE
jgi:hypothetical protein